jgi:hypothetical protein
MIKEYQILNIIVKILNNINKVISVDKVISKKRKIKIKIKYQDHSHFTVLLNLTINYKRMIFLK